MRRRVMISAFVAICVSIGALSAEANISSNRWFYEVTQDGRDVQLTLQLIEEEPPNFDTTWKLVRGGDVLFEHKQFVREEADETIGPGACIEDNQTDGPIADCDGDGTDDCAGICGTAYRYSYFDECVPGDHPEYVLYDEANLDENGDPVGAYEGWFHVVDWGAGSTDDPCLGSSGCSVAGAPGRATEAGLAALMLMIGLGFVVVARRKKSR